MPKLPFLETKNTLWTDHSAAWERDERRLAGGDEILSELVQWKNEDEKSFKQRTDSARYLNFPDIHATVLAGHIKSQSPLGTFGDLGEPRPRAEQNKGQKNLAELITYNADGIGIDGSQYPAWLNGITRRAIATGFRWMFCEMPSLAALAAIRRRKGRSESGPVDKQDQLDGFRPYGIEYSPLAVERWRYSEGVLQWAAVRIPVEPPKEIEDKKPATDKGWYLMVRNGYEGLGSRFQQGGWWKLDPDHEELSAGPWDLSGEIPLFQIIAKRSTGTFAKPAIAQSLTMEIGQIAVDIMNARSEQRHNLRQAAKGTIWVLGIDPGTHKLVVEQNDTGSFVVGVPPVVLPDGVAGIPQLWNSSEGAVAGTAYKEMLDDAIAEAREVMVKQIASAPDASGEKVKATFEEGSTPLLAGLAEGVETADNTFRQFCAQRLELAYGGVVTYPREYRIRDTISDIDKMLDTLKNAGAESPTWTRKLVIKQGETLGVLDDDDDKQAIEDELEQGIKDKIEQKKQLQAALAGQGGPAPGEKEPAPPSNEDIAA